MIRASLLLLPLLAGCYEPDCATWGEVGWNDDAAFSVQPGDSGALLALTAEDAGQWLYGVSGYLQVENPTDSDCLVAVYVKDGGDPPDPSLLPALEPAKGAPDRVEGLGELAYAVNLAQQYSSTDAAWADLALPAAGGEVATYVTIATCAEGGITGSLTVYADYCDTSESLPRYEAQMHPESFALDRRW